MSSYVVLARKWRSAQFEDVVGQGHIVRTLMNAIRTNRVHQAYLFTGSRGIGKTSIARIFAKVLRCEHVKDKKDWLSSCDECSSCKEITSSSSVDVIEIDGASNNGVEAVREIRENAKYMPQTGSRKIYIIDEVHMLTTAAFNALLKTLEEPPQHVIFIFATTEAHKIPATILSRCQRFDFRRYTSAQIQPHLAKIAKSEGIDAEPAALALISRAAEGGMRDALSMLDQVIAFSGNKVTVDSTRESIGLIEGQSVLGIISGIFRRKPLEALALVDQAYQRGHDLRVLTRSLIEFLHGAILAKIGAPTSGLLEVSEEEWKELGSIAAHRELEEIELIFQVLHQGLDWIARSPQPKVVLDILLVKCATAEALVSVERSGGPANPSSSATPRAEGAQGPAPGAPMATAPMTTAPSAGSTPSPVTAPTQPATVSPARAIAESLARAQTTKSSLAAPQPTAQVGLENRTKTATVSEQSPPISQASSGGGAPSGAPTVTGSKTWEFFIEHVRKDRPLLASILEHGTCQSFPSPDDKAPVIAIGFASADAYFREQLSTPVTQGQLQELGASYLGKKPRFQIDLLDGPAESLASKKKKENEDRERLAKEAAQNHPIIREARSLFGSELGPVEILSPDGGPS